MTQEQLFNQLRKMFDVADKNELINTKRKLKRALEQRDEWKAQALEYRKRILQK
jgi:hypothetical protein